MNQRRALEASAAPLWIDEARDHLKIAGKHEPGLNLRLLCSEAHLGAEKAVKGVMIARGEVFRTRTTSACCSTGRHGSARRFPTMSARGRR